MNKRTREDFHVKEGRASKLGTSFTPKYKTKNIFAVNKLGSIQIAGHIMFVSLTPN